MGKIMTTGDMYNWAEKHPEARFIRGMNGFVYRFEENRLYFTNRDGIAKPCDVFPKLNDQWELMPEAVDFMTAALFAGDDSSKRIRPENDNGEGFMRLNSWKLTKERLNGKWYIEEQAGGTN